MNKDNILIFAGTSGLIVAAAIVISLRSPISPDRLAGAVTVLMLLGIAVLDYRVTWKKLFTR